MSSRRRGGSASTRRAASAPSGRRGANQPKWVQRAESEPEPASLEPVLKSSRDALTEPEVWASPAVDRTVAYHIFTHAPCASLVVEAYSLDPAQVEQAASATLRTRVSPNGNVLQMSDLLEFTKRGRRAVRSADPTQDVLVLAADSTWPDNFAPLTRGMDVSSSVETYFKDSVQTMDLYPQPEFKGGGAAVVFNDVDVARYLNAAMGLSAPDEVPRRRWSAVARAIDKAVEGYSSFEMIPYTDPGKAASNYIFLSVHAKGQKAYFASGVQFGWLFKQNYASDGIWNKDAFSYLQYKYDAANTVQWSRTPLPVLIQAARHVNAISGTPQPRNLLARAAAARAYSAAGSAIGRRGGADKKGRYVNEIRPVEWWAMARNASLATAPMPAFRISGSELAWYERADVVGRGGFGKVLRTVWHHGFDLKRGRAAAGSTGNARDDYLIDVLSRKHVLTATGKVDVAVALKTIPGGYDERAADILDIQMERTWAIMLMNLAPVGPGGYFTRRYITTIYGYIVHDSYIGLVMEFMPSSIELEIEAFVAEAKYILQTQAAPGGDSSVRSPGWFTTPRSADDPTRPINMQAVHDRMQYYRRKLPLAKRLTPAHLLRALADCAFALAFLHLHGIVHRDVKPGNILVGADGRGYLADFTFVEFAGKPDSVSGTPGYIPAVVNAAARQNAEQYARRAPPGSDVHPFYTYPDFATDIYAMGVVIKEVLSLRVAEDRIWAPLYDLTESCINIKPGLTMAEVHRALHEIYQLDAASAGLK